MIFDVLCFFFFLAVQGHIPDLCYYLCMRGKSAEETESWNETIKWMERSLRRRTRPPIRAGGGFFFCTLLLIFTRHFLNMDHPAVVWLQLKLTTSSLQKWLKFNPFSSQNIKVSVI